MPKFYILDADNNPVGTDDVHEWVEFRRSQPGGLPRVAEDFVGDVYVSTIFLGIDHNYWDEGPPIVFETMVFGGKLERTMARYATYEEAKQGHADMLRRVRAEEGQ